MPKFSAASRGHLEGVHPDLVMVANEAIKHWDFSVTDGVRTVGEQKLNILRGVSQTMNSKHLPQKDGYSHAIDVHPYPVDWDAITKGIAALRKADPKMQSAEYYMFIGFFLGMAQALGVQLASGVDWDGDREFSEHSFQDLPHLQLVKARRCD